MTRLPSVHIPYPHWDIRYAWLVSQQSGLPLYYPGNDEVVYIDGIPIIIIHGMLTDLASIPKGARNTFCPADPRYVHAALPHDLLYGAEILPRGDSDLIFWAILKHDGVAGIEDDIMYQAVNLAGWITYDKHTLESVMALRSLMGIGSKERPLLKSMGDLKDLWKISTYYRVRKIVNGKVHMATRRGTGDCANS